MAPGLLLMVTGAYRHGKALGAWGGGTGVLEAAGLSAASVGVVVGERAAAVLRDVTDLLSGHRAWDRFTPAV
ncbi:hypothetical protein [Streptomyces hirsutus]|uniref:hypothetical protein n=1 Tax=Streptomyces hirsutus TaxID=35620 RepID=UPI003323C216